MATLKQTPPVKKIYHRGAKIDPYGNVSALCYEKPKKIPCGETWTLRDQGVTCEKCLAKMGEKATL